MLDNLTSGVQSITEENIHSSRGLKILEHELLKQTTPNSNLNKEADSEPETAIVKGSMYTPTSPIPHLQFLISPNLKTRGIEQNIGSPVPMKKKKSP